MKKTITTILQGGVMGVAEVIPGISGSTLALIMGIYDDFINLLHDSVEFAKELLKFILKKSTKKKLKKSFQLVNIGFGLKLLLGMIITVVLFSHILTYLLDTYPAYLFAVFFGIILVSIYVPYKRIEKPRIRDLMIIALTTVVFYLIFGLEANSQQSEAPYWFIFLGGIIGISGMVLPGISGSFLLFLLGIYELVVSSISEITKLNFSGESNPILVLFVFGLGVLTGFASFIKLLKTALTKYPNEIMSFVTGLMIASLRVVWPFKESTSNTESFISSVLILVSGLLIYIFIMKTRPEDELQKID